VTAAPRPIGPWRPEGVEYVRRKENPFWAADPVIPAKGSRRRVVLVGESAARGYLYDPELSFADVLRAGTAAEVVDLACTNLTAAGLQQVLVALPALEPDAVIVFAGNNWDNLALGLPELDRCAEGLRREGFLSVQRIFRDELLLPQSRAVIDLLGALRSALDVEITVVVPETNLVDWQPERSVLTAVLPADGLPEWLALYPRAAEDPDAARRMIALDGGVSPASQHLLGTALHRAGERAAARVALEASRDAFCGLLVPHPPRCPGVVQALLRESGLRVVDLPAVFEAHTGDLPGRRMFLDYCHLTLEGMRVAAAAILDGAGEPSVAPEVEATAHLLATLHNVHYGQEAAVVRHHCRAALEHSPGVAPVLAELVRAQASSWPSWLTSAFAAVCRLPQAARYLVRKNPNDLAKTADHELIGIVAGELARAGLPAPDPDDVAAAGHAPGPVDLVDPRHHARTFQEHVGLRMGPVPAYYRGHLPTSTFFLVCQEVCARRLRVTARVPGLDGPAEAELWLNDKPFGAVRVSARWTVTELAAERLRAGVNRFEIRWPAAVLRAAEVFERGARRLERGELPDVLPVFGEVHSFTVTPEPDATLA
jgi:hypothetical protein